MAGVQAELHFDSPVRVSFDTGTTALVAAGQVPQSPEPSVPLPGLLVDEDAVPVRRAPAELELFDRLYGSVEDGAFNVVLVSGEPGIGKTRLAAEAARLAHARDWTVLYGRCDERVRTPFQPFVDTLESFVGFTPDESLASRLGQYAGELTRLLPSLSTRIADLDPPVQSDPETERYQMFQAVADWLRTSARGRPIMLIVDDLQWAEQPTLLLLRHLVRTPDLVRLLVVATYRDTKPERGDTLDEMLADLSPGPPRRSLRARGTRRRSGLRAPHTQRGHGRERRDRAAGRVDSRRDGRQSVLRARADPAAGRARCGRRLGRARDPPGAPERARRRRAAVGPSPTRGRGPAHHRGGDRR